MIRGYYRGEFPFLAAFVTFRGVESIPTVVEFLVDSGAEVSVLQSHDLERIGVDPALFADRPIEWSVGVGGRSAHRRVMAYLEFDEASATDERTRYRISLRIAHDSDPLLPSVLGLDILNGFKVTLSWRDSLVTLEPHA